MFVLFPVFPPSLLCLPVSVCVWQGAWLLLSCSRSDTPVLNSFQSPLSLKAWSSLHSDAGLLLLHAFVWCFSTRLFMLFASRIYQPASTLPFQAVSASPALPAVSSRYLPLLLSLPFPAGTCLSCSPCRPSRYLPPLLTLPFQPESTSPDLINFVKFLSTLVVSALGSKPKHTLTE